MLTEEGYARSCQLPNIPENIARLRDLIVETSRQSRLENERFEALLQRIPIAVAKTPELSKNSPLKSSRTTPTIDNPIEHVNQMIQQLRREERDFESYLRRALLDA